MKKIIDILRESISVANSNQSKDIEQMFWRLNIGETIDTNDHNLKHLSAERVKDNYPASRGRQWNFAKTQKNGRYSDWVFLSKDKREAIVLKVDVHNDKIISIKKRKAITDS